MVPPTASPKRIARSTAPRLSTGSVPGSARSTADACVLGGAPNAVEAPEKIFDAVVSCAWVSRPMTISQVIARPDRIQAGNTEGTEDHRGPQRRARTCDPKLAERYGIVSLLFSVFSVVLCVLCVSVLTQ